MKLKYKAVKKSRINHSFMGFTSFDGIHWYNDSHRCWDCNYDGVISSHAPCNSVRAFRRLLKNAPHGIEFILVSRWVGYDVYGKGSKK